MVIEKEIGELLRSRHLTMGTAESCTGGYIAHLITRVAGSSDYFCGGVVSYSNEVKHHVLGVSEDSLAQYGAVSRPVVEQMALGAIRVLGCDCAVATSGIAGPGGGTPEKPVGTGTHLGENPFARGLRRLLLELRPKLTDFQTNAYPVPAGLRFLCTGFTSIKTCNHY